MVTINSGAWTALFALLTVIFVRGISTVPFNRVILMLVERPDVNLPINPSFWRLRPFAPSITPHLPPRESQLPALRQRPILRIVLQPLRSRMERVHLSLRLW